MPIVQSKTLTKAILEALIAEDGLLDTAKIMLWSNDDLVPDEDTVYADLTASVFTGYAASADLVWQNPYLDAETGDWKLTCNPITFRSTTGSPYVGDVAYGYAIYIPGTPNVLRYIEKFSEFKGFSVPDRILTIAPEISGSALLLN